MSNKDDKRIPEIKDLETWRKNHGISQEAMARKLDVALVTYSSWVTGKSLKVSTDNFFKIGTLLDKLSRIYLHCPTKDLYVANLPPEAGNREPYSKCPICANSNCEWNYQEFGDFVKFDDIEGPRVINYAYTYTANDDRIIKTLDDDRIEGSLKEISYTVTELKKLTETERDKVEIEPVGAKEK